MARTGDVERFDRWADSYDRHWMQRVVFEAVHGAVLELASAEVARPGAILDIGCGTGRLLRMAGARFPGAELVGVDPAPQMVRRASAAAGVTRGIRFVEAIAENLPLPDARFDLVFSTLTFHHWAEPAAAAREIARVLAPGGRWLLADFIPTGLLRHLLGLFRIDRFPDHESLKGVLAPAGLRVLRHRGAPGWRRGIGVVVIGAATS